MVKLLNNNTLCSELVYDIESKISNFKIVPNKIETTIQKRKIEHNHIKNELRALHNSYIIHEKNCNYIETNLQNMKKEMCNQLKMVTASKNKK
jgi:ribosome recycling factor